MEWDCLRASNPFLQTHFVEAIEVRFQIPEFHPKNYIDNSKRYSKWYLWRLKSRQTFQQLVLKRDMYSSFFVEVLKIFPSHIVLCTKFTHDIWENIFRLFCFLEFWTSSLATWRKRYDNGIENGMKSQKKNLRREKFRVVRICMLNGGKGVKKQR